MTVLELLVAMTMVSFIILVLYQMFDRTQAQMRNAIKQVDTLESGRSMMGILYRDLSRMVAPPEDVNVSFAVGELNSSYGVEMLHVSSVDAFFTNKMESVFFTAYDAEATPTNWVGMIFGVWHPDIAGQFPTNGFGSLYRYETHASRFTTDSLGRFVDQTYTNNTHKIAENIVHFRVNFFADGISTNWTAAPNPVQLLRGLVKRTLPRIMEVEIGYLDAETATIAASFGSQAAARQFIAARPEKVTFFRFQVPLRSPR